MIGISAYTVRRLSSIIYYMCDWPKDQATTLSLSFLIFKIWVIDPAHSVRIK